MTTPRLGAPELTSGQATPETTVNEQIRYLESGAGHFIFKDRDLATPPGSPADGDCYLVAGSPTGAWTGHAGDIAFRVNTAWAFIEAIEGFTAWVNDENAFLGYDGSAWQTLSAPSGSYLPLTGGTLSGDLVVPDEAYDATAWNGSLEVPTKNAIRDKLETLAAGIGGGDLLSTNNLSDLANAATARTNLGIANLGTALPLTFNFSDAGDAYFYADEAMTLTQQATTGAGSVSYEKGTTAAPDTFTSTSSPISLQAGAWLKVSADDAVAVHLKRTA